MFLARILHKLIDAEEKSKPELLEFMSKISSIPAASGSEFSLLFVREGPTEFGPTDKDLASCWSKSTSGDGPGMCGPGDRQVLDPGDGQRLLRWACFGLSLLGLGLADGHH
ncbi:hypothetical protein M9H77_02595 [Catharanthus roseus]|uniref:Uncharacterized protein n=1 Tax=Catharanthus roseus TaxID=4058 RepID=A0ACC0C8S4_CATRO|nr:hypothetical protein M9H77_02595 [Catharanthus roseus]